MTDNMREEFDVWAAPIGLDVDYIYADDAFKCYCFTETQNVFEVWKAGWEKSRAALCVELPEVRVLDGGRIAEIGYELAVDDFERALDAAGVQYK